MADKKEKDLTKVSDAAYIRALDSNGNPVLISKADLAQVAAELIWIKLSPEDSFNGDFNTLTANGVYRFGGESTNCPAGATAGGLAIVVCWHSQWGDVVAQFVTNDRNKWYVRTKWYNEDWMAWAQLT